MDGMRGKWKGYTTGENDLLIAPSPGRFFIQQEFKMLLAYMVMNYDLERLPERPSNLVWGPINTPPPATKIRVRRRAGTVSHN